MQMITSRQNRLLRFLLPRREYTTIVTIAGYLNVSEKTIQRDLRLLEQWLGQWRINVEKRAGAGVMLSAEILLICCILIICWWQNVKRLMV